VRILKSFTELGIKMCSKKGDGESENDGADGQIDERVIQRDGDMINEVVRYKWGCDK
jgi:hypothetical protein